MGFRVVKEGEPSLQVIERELPALPKAEASRIRRAARGAFDVLLPGALAVLKDALESENMDDRKWAADKIFKQTIANIPNETRDPEEVVVDSSAKEVDALSELEKSTENGTGLDDPA